MNGLYANDDRKLIGSGSDLILTLSHKIFCCVTVWLTIALIILTFFLPASLIVLISKPSLAQTASLDLPKANNRIGKVLGNPTVPNGIGVNIHFVDQQENELIRIQQMGFHLIRTDFMWSTVELRRSVYTWDAYDRMSAQLHKHKLIPLFVLDYANALYYPEKRDKDAVSPLNHLNAPFNKEAQAAFIAFARAAVARYKGAVIWEVWNEPNLTFGKPPRVDIYADFAVAVCRAIRQVDSNVAVIGPASGLFDFDLLKRFLAADTTGCFDAISVHPYRDEGPESVLQDWAHLRGEISQIGANPHCTMVDSEIGYSVTGGPWTEHRQADYDTRAYILDLLAGVPITIIYDIRNDSTNTRDKESNFGLFGDLDDPRYAGRTKQSGMALSSMIRDLNGLTLLGQVDSDMSNMILAFGTEAGPTKLVAWAVRDAVSVSIGPDICVRSIGHEDQSCVKSAPSSKIEPQTLRLTGSPIVLPLDGKPPPIR